jgi:hypothetical protein
MFLRRVMPLKFNFFKYGFSQTKPANQNIDFKTETEPSNRGGGDKKLSDEALKTISEYKDALNYYQQGKYRISDELFKRVLNILEQSKMQGTDNYTHVLKK